MKKSLIITSLVLVALTSMAQHNNDWAQTSRYAQANIEINRQANDGKRVVMMGNSITEIWAKQHSEFFRLTRLIGRGISGQTSAQMLARFDKDVIALNPQAVVILAGTNDIAENGGPYSEEQTMANIAKMCEQAKSHKIKVILSSVLPCNKMYWSNATGVTGKIESLNKRIKNYAQKNKIHYIDYYSYMIDRNDGSLHHAYTNDGVHPNMAGYATMEPLLVNALNKCVKR